MTKCFGWSRIAAAAIVATATVVAGCGVVPGERPPLHVFNDTTLVVRVSVNGQPIGDFHPGVAGPEIDVDSLPPLPWIVEARTVTGRLLASMEVEPGQVFRTTLPDGNLAFHDRLESVELSCGRLTLFAGELRPGAAGGPPRTHAGVPGDCVP